MLEYSFLAIIGFLGGCAPRRRFATTMDHLRFYSSYYCIFFTAIVSGKFAARSARGDVPMTIDLDMWGLTLVPLAAMFLGWLVQRSYYREPEKQAVK